MTLSYGKGTSLPSAVLLVLYVFTILVLAPAAATANPDVYASLPDDTQVVTYSIGDYDGDGHKELSVLYLSAGKIHLTFFDGDIGRWSKWGDATGPLLLEDGTLPRSMESVDTTGDGRAEIFIYYLTENSTAMTARVFSVDILEGPHLSLGVILEDTTSPAGYPILGKEGEDPSVTFMRMATGSSDGYRRVYCWKGEEFEVCEEVVWEKP